MHPRRWFIAVAGSLAGLFALLAGLNAWVDPLLQYRYRPELSPYLDASQRLLNPGALRRLDYDVLALGTSMVQNLRPSLIRASLGGKPFNAALAGASAHEQARTFELAVATGKPKRILWGIDLFAYSGPATRGADNLPDYLYDETHGDDIRYLLNPDTTRRSLRTLKGHARGDLGRDFDWDWLSGKERDYGIALVRAAVAEGRFLDSYDPASYGPEVLRASARANLLEPLRAHPELEVDLFFPPYSLLAWDHLDRIGALGGLLAFKRELVAELVKLPHVRVHDFQDWPAVTRDLDNYRDESHYSPAVGQRMLARIVSAEARITEAAGTEAGLRAQLEGLDRDALLRGERPAFDAGPGGN